MSNYCFDKVPQSVKERFLEVSKRGSCTVSNVAFIELLTAALDVAEELAIKQRTEVCRLAAQADEVARAASELAKGLRRFCSA